jgi:ribosomal subunit interface protein
MEVNISAKNLTVSDRFREYVAERTHKIELLTHRVETLQIKVTRHDHSKTTGPEDQVELTVLEPGHVVRAEAHAGDKFAAFDIALGKLAERLRRAADRHKVHRGQHRQASVGEMAATDFASLDITPVDADALPSNHQDATHDEGWSPIVIRRKEFKGEAMSAEEAIYQMEMVGHDFFLFHDTETNKDSVVYRRKGWNYGVITLK